MKIASQLEACIDPAKFVRLTRRGRRVDGLDGVITAVGRKWLVLAEDYNAGFLGSVMLRVKDVRAVEAKSSDSFLRKAWSSEGCWPAPQVNGVSLSSTSEMLKSLSTLYPLLTMHYEYEHPDECTIGVPLRYRRKSVEFRTIDPDAEWTDDEPTLRYRDISRVDVGDDYARRLLRVGGPPPARGLPQG